MKGFEIPATPTPVATPSNPGTSIPSNESNASTWCMLFEYVTFDQLKRSDIGSVRLASYTQKLPKRDHEAVQNEVDDKLKYI